MTRHDRGVVYEEVQRFRQPWLWFVVGVLVTVAMAPLLEGLPVRESWTLRLFLPWAIGTGAVVLTAVLLFTAKLRVVVDESKVLVSFMPFYRRAIALERIARAHARTYRPLLDAGGWGMHYSPTGAGMVFNVSGNRGVQIELENGKRILIGSNHADELLAAINAAKTN